MALRRKLGGGSKEFKGLGKPILAPDGGIVVYLVLFHGVGVFPSSWSKIGDTNGDVLTGSYFMDLTGSSTKLPSDLLFWSVQNHAHSLTHANGE